MIELNLVNCLLPSHRYRYKKATQKHITITITSTLDRQLKAINLIMLGIVMLRISGQEVDKLI